MKKMILTSDGMTSKKIKKEFLRVIEKPVSEIKVLIIYTLMKMSYIKYLRKVKSELIKLGVRRKNLIYANISNNIKPVKEEYDVIYSCGGNTFYILDRIRKTRFGEVIKNFVNNGGLYIGVSAGSMIIFKDIKLSGYGSEGDINSINLKNLKGLNVVDISIYPHYHVKLEKELKEFEKMEGYKVKRLKDGEAILINGKSVKLIKQTHYSELQQNQ